MRAPVEITPNNRRASRKSLLLTAKLTCDRGSSSYECSIPDLSKTGARIRFARNVDLPAIIHLIDLRNRMAYEAKVVWRRPPNFGLAFISASAIGDPATPQFLKKIWFASMQ